jgi:UDP-N-acetylmuramoyl-tripeptide--D-alanyl-D-alanine ligase
LAAITVARHFGVSDDEILSSLSKIKREPGRMNPIPGIKGSLILDSSYNAAPASVQSALEVLGEFNSAEGARRIAVLGYMAELGKYSEQEHRMIGMRAQEAGVDLLVTVGEVARDIRRGAIEAGLREDQTQHFSNSVEAGRWLDSQIKKGDIILVKGSQSVRMERVVKDIMAEPSRAEELLVRQDWKDA